MQAEEHPQNGIAGLSHWCHDPGAGMQVALVSLPQSPGIAVASGAPPITAKRMTSSERRPAAHRRRQRIRLKCLVYIEDIPGLGDRSRPREWFAPEDSGWNQGCNYN
jgi:hypothetical protein